MGRFKYYGQILDFMEKRVVIVGAGVIGLVLAKELGKYDIGVTVYEANKEVGETANRASGILSIYGLDRIGVDYSKAIVNTLDGAILYVGKKSLKIKAKHPKAYVLDRKVLAQICAKEAKASGAEIVLNSRLERDSLKELASNSIIVGADGAVSNVASAFGFPKIGEYVLTYKAEYENSGITDINSAELFFSMDRKQRFFGWTVPYSKNVLEIGIGESMHSKRNSFNAFKSFINSSYLNERIANANRISGHASIIPLEARKKTVNGNVLLVGDAAGQVKATTGGGIIFGTMCAKIAASVIKENIEKGTSLLAYERLWRKRYGLDLMLHRIIHNYYSSMSQRSFELVFRMSQLIGLESLLGKYGDMDSPSKTAKGLIFRMRNI